MPLDHIDRTEVICRRPLVNDAVLHIPVAVFSKADGGTTSETGKESWGASSDRSELDGSFATTTRLSSGANQDVDGDELLAGSKIRRRTSGAGGLEGGDGNDVHDDARRKGEASESGQKRGRNMLFISGMMGVKRHCLGTLRY